MKTIQIYVHGENNREPKLVEVSEEASVKDVVNKYLQEFPNSGGPEDVEFFVEDEEEQRPKEETGEKGGIKRKVHIHCHRCKKVSVAVEYNGQTITLNVPPSMFRIALLYCLYCIVLYCIVLYCIVLYCLVLRCTNLHFFTNLKILICN